MSGQNILEGRKNKMEVSTTSDVVKVNDGVCPFLLLCYGLAKEYDLHYSLIFGCGIGRLRKGLSWHFVFFELTMRASIGKTFSDLSAEPIMIPNILAHVVESVCCAVNLALFASAQAAIKRPLAVGSCGYYSHFAAAVAAVVVSVEEEALFDFNYKSWKTGLLSQMTSNNIILFPKIMELVLQNLNGDTPHIAFMHHTKHISSMCMPTSARKTINDFTPKITSKHKLLMRNKKSSTTHELM
ncbi:hypothetical protein ACJX0J_019289 [Zea mays]